MSIQSAINQGISIASMLYSQTADYKAKMETKAVATDYKAGIKRSEELREAAKELRSVTELPSGGKRIDIEDYTTYRKLRDTSNEIKNAAIDKAAEAGNVEAIKEQIARERHQRIIHRSKGRIPLEQIEQKKAKAQEQLEAAKAEKREQGRQLIKNIYYSKGVNNE